MVAGAIAGLSGLAVGSFLNVVVHRVPSGASIVSPPSRCPSCEAPIRPVDNVPVLSYLWLRGRCRHCRTRISPEYPIVELLTAAAFVVAVLRHDDLVDAAFVAAASAVLIAIAFIDLHHRRVPNVISLPGAAVASVWVIAAGLIQGQASSIVAALACGAAGFVLLLLIALVSGGMGFGDVKLMLFIGIVTGWFGWEVFVLALFAGFALGGVASIVLILIRRAGRKDAIPFAPMLAGGALIALGGGPGPVRAWLGA